MNRLTTTSVCIAATVAICGGALALTSTASADDWKHRTTLRDAAGAEVGTVSFKDQRRHTEVRVRIESLPLGSALDAFHGFHIHANDDLTNGVGCVAPGFTSADGHWKAGTTTHGAHLGDMPSLYVNADGSSEARFTIDRIDLSQLGGKAVVLHAGPDNFGNVPPDQYSPAVATALTTTQNTGNAGARIACGVITGD